MNRRGLAACLAAAVALAAVLAAGYAAAGPAGLVDAAAVAAAGGLVVARGTLLGQEPRSVRTRIWRHRARAPAVSTEEFPAYRKIVSDLSWAPMSRRHYEHGTRSTLARLATALGRPDPAGDVPGPLDPDGPGVDLATLHRVVARLEEDA